MALSISMLALSCVSIVAFTALNVNIKIRKFKVHLYWMIPAFCAVILLATGTVDYVDYWDILTSNLNINPAKVLILFISMSAISVFLDQCGLFRWLASRVMKSAGKSQIKLFLMLYVVISLLTIVTSNSTIILTFTPFICYFAKHSGLNPVPYLFAEFVGANTFSMFLLIGNATNTYIASSFGISFIEYISVMAVPTLFASAVSLSLLILLFRKQLLAPIQTTPISIEIKNKPALGVGLTGLIVCTILLIISSYIGIEMWMVAGVSALFVLTFGSICFLQKKQGLGKTRKTLRRMPWHLIPFLLSMYVIVMALDNTGVTSQIANIFKSDNSLWSAGIISALSSNFMNNIPMSILFTDILMHTNTSNLGAVYATIIGSNMGSLMTPVASMSAIMWRSVIKHKHINFSFGTFLKYGACIVLPTLFSALAGLYLMLNVLG